MKISCPYCVSEAKISTETRTTHRTGRFWRKSDGQWIARFWCSSCQKGFSSSTLTKPYRQKKRHKNALVRKLLSGGMSQREVARTLKLNRKTVVRKFLFLAELEAENLKRWNQEKSLATEVEFDDLETFEHSKCKPLSITLMVEYKTRRILGFEVSQMPAKGKLASLARKKYGPRKDKRAQGRANLFKEMKELVIPQALIRSDSIRM